MKLLGTLRNWRLDSLLHQLRLNQKAGFRFLPAFGMVLASVSGAGLRHYERRRFDPLAARTRLQRAPLFVIGHWRSGTTHLHNLLCRDPAMGWVTTFQAMAPTVAALHQCCLRPGLERLGLGDVRFSRPMDNMAVSLASPQEEEFALAALGPYSFYHQWTFPRTARYYFDRYALLEGLPEQELAAWQRQYAAFLQKVAWLNGGRRLVLKNPVNTARIGRLLELFPGARFVYIYRNPYRVFASTRHMMRRMIGVYQLQAVSHRQIDANILYFYRELLARYQAQKHLPARNRLAEVRYEALTADPLGQLERIYAELELDGFEDAAPAMRRYLDGLGGYRRNRYRLGAGEVSLVNRHWGFAVEQGGYAPPVAGD